MKRRRGKNILPYKRWYSRLSHTAKEHERQAELKELVYRGYGAKCACCGETGPKFLTLDHVNNDGFKDRHRRMVDVYREIIKNHFPPTFQIMCFNCNCGRAMNGGVCPHLGIVINRPATANGFEKPIVPLPLFDD